MADTDILTLQEARDAVNLTATDADADLARMVTGITGRIDDLCGPVVKRTITDERHDGGRSRIWLDETPVLVVTAVKEFRSTTETTLTAETNASHPTNAYLLDNIGNTYFIWRRSGGSDTDFPTGRRNVVVTYDAGRFNDTASVSEKFKQACQGILRRMWKREQSAWAQGPDYFPTVEDPATADRFRGFFRAVDPMVKELLVDELKPPPVA